MTKSIHILVVITLAATASCGAETSDPGGEVFTTTTAGEQESTTTVEEAEMDVVAVAIADLATRIFAPENEIGVISTESVTWPDGSLGCPEPGKQYTQALVEGGRIVLRHDERVYVYHYGDMTQPFLCENPDSKDGGYDFVPPPGFDEK